LHHGMRNVVNVIRSFSTDRFVSYVSISSLRPNRRPVDTSVGTVARISNRLHKIRGALKGPIEGHTFESDTGIDLTDSEYVSKSIFFELVGK